MLSIGMQYIVNGKKENTRGYDRISKHSHPRSLLSIKFRILAFILNASFIVIIYGSTLSIADIGL